MGLSIALGMIAFEMLAFLTGFTMFNTNSNLLCILALIYKFQVKWIHIYVFIWNEAFKGISVEENMRTYKLFDSSLTL